MNILVLGGTGLIGRYLLKRLLALGHNVHVVSRNPDKVQFNSVSLQVIRADIGSADWLGKIDAGSYHVIYHLAYATTEDEAYNRTVTVDSVRLLMNQLKNLGNENVRHFVYVGSMVVFGLSPKDSIVTEISEKIADSVYAANKIAATTLALDSSAPFLTTVIHPTGVYDETSKRIEFYRQLLEQNYIPALSSGNGINNIVYADDVALALINCLNRPTKNKSEEYLINGEAIAYREWLGLLEKTVKQRNKVRVPAFMKVVFRGPIRRFVNSLGVRCPIYISKNKQSEYERKTIFSSAKATADFSYAPRIKFIDVCSRLGGGT